MRVLHINLNTAGLGRYGLLYGKALGACTGMNAVSVFDERLLHSAILREQANGFDYRLIKWSGTASDKLIALRDLRRIVADVSPDVIHDTAGSYAKNVVIWPLLVRRAPLVVTEHDPVPHLGMHARMGSRAAKRLMRRMASHVFVHGPLCRQLLLMQGWPLEKISTLRHGHLGMFDRGAYRDVGRQEREILFFGELRFNKGVDLLPEIARRVVQRVPEARFVVAGSSRNGAPTPDWAETVHHLVEAMKRQPYFEVHDRFIPDEEVEYFFRRAGITLMPYREATQSGVAMIAMPLQSTIVVTNVGDIRDVVQHGETGFIAEPDVESIARLLVELLEDPARAGRARAAAYAFVTRECDWSVIVQKALRAYRQVTGSDHENPPASASSFVQAEAAEWNEASTYQVT